MHYIECPYCQHKGTTTDRQYVCPECHGRSWLKTSLHGKAQLIPDNPSASISRSFHSNAQKSNILDAECPVCNHDLSFSENTESLICENCETELDVRKNKSGKFYLLKSPGKSSTQENTENKETGQSNSPKAKKSNNLIFIKCPECGANQQIDREKKAYTCNQCGMISLVRHSKAETNSPSNKASLMKLFIKVNIFLAAIALFIMIGKVFIGPDSIPEPNDQQSIIESLNENIQYNPRAIPAPEIGDSCTGDCFNGSGTYQVVGGSYGGFIYSGQFQNGRITGQGKWTAPSGEVYTGSFLNGMRHGYGSYTPTNGLTYTGNWSNDYLSGTGFITNPDGTTCQAEFIAGSEFPTCGKKDVLEKTLKSCSSTSVKPGELNGQWTHIQSKHQDLLSPKISPVIESWDKVKTYIVLDNQGHEIRLLYNSDDYTEKNLHYFLTNHDTDFNAMKNITGGSVFGYAKSLNQTTLVIAEDLSHIDIYDKDWKEKIRRGRIYRSSDEYKLRHGYSTEESFKKEMITNSKVSFWIAKKFEEVNKNEAICWYSQAHKQGHPEAKTAMNKLLD